MKIAIALVMVCLTPVCIVAGTEHRQLSTADEAFLKSAAVMDMTEAHLGQMAQGQAADDSVKNVGNTLVQDHTKDYEELSKLAAKTGASIPKGIDIRRNRAIEAMAHQSGAAFDREFVRYELQDHRRAIGEFKREAEHGHDANVRSYAQSTLPTLQAHLGKVEQAEKSEGSFSPASTGQRKR